MANCWSIAEAYLGILWMGESPGADFELTSPWTLGETQRYRCGAAKNMWKSDPEIERKTEILLRVIRNFLFSLILYVCKLHGPKPSVHVDFSSFTCNQMPVHHWKKKHCRLQRSSCASTILFLFGPSSRWLTRGYGHVSSLAQQCRETSNTKHLCRCVLTSWYFEDQTVPSLSNWPVQLQPVDPARNSGRKLEYLHSWVLFCNYIIIRT